jgi:hypothetical protein
MSLPIACGLTDAEFRERRSDTLQKVGQMVLEVKELVNGYAYRFPSDDDTFTQIADLVRFEKACCPFLRFRITVESGNGDLWLELTGEQGTKTFLTSLF